jgi:hypothetical protein
MVISVGLKCINFCGSSSELMTSLEIPSQGRIWGFKSRRRPILRPKPDGVSFCEDNLSC